MMTKACHRQPLSPSAPQAPAGLMGLLRPRAIFEAIWEIDLDWLRSLGVRALLVDLDNTLVDWNGSLLRPQVLNWLARARESGLTVCICSNARRSRRVAEIARQAQAGWLAPAGKPGCGRIRRLIGGMGLPPSEVAMVGDQILTDVLAGNRLGTITLLVRPLSRRDFPLTKIARLVERLLLARMGDLSHNRGLVGADNG